MWSKLTRVMVFVVGIALPLSGQYYFEKNKIQRDVEPTYTYETQHFSIYVEEGGEPLAQFAAGVLEEAYAQDIGDFGFEVGGKIPVIIYKSQPDFAATNILLEPIEESVGGFSELFKNRVVVPFTGSYEELHHVLYHELTHIFQFELYFSLAISNLFSLIPGFTPPLWIMEGSAEFCSSHGGAEEDAFMRDLLLSNEIILLEELENWQGYIVYRQGESVFLFIEDRYGREKVFELLHALKINRDMDAAFAKVFGMTVKEFGKQWLNWLRLRYWPDVAKLENRDRDARLLTDHEKDFTWYNGSAALSPSGSKIAYATTKGDYLTVNVVSAFDGKLLKKLLTAGRSATFERLPLLRRDLAWSSDETQLAAVGFSREKPILILVNYSTGKVDRRYALNVDDAYAPALSPDCKRAVYVGIKDGTSDLYLLELESGKVERLTYDMYEEQDPSFDSSAVIFVSDKPDQDSVWKVGQKAVWSLSPSGRTTRISPRFSTLRTPYLVAGKLVFVGPEFQLYLWNAADSTLLQLTNWFESIEELSLSSNGKAAMLVYNQAGWDVAMLNGSLDRLIVSSDTSQTLSSSDKYYTFIPDELSTEDFSPYKVTFSPDFIYGSGAYSSLYGATGSFSMGISDMLGDHRIYIDAALYGDILYSDIVASYWFLKRRLDVAVGAFQMADFFYYWPTDTSTTFTYVKRAQRGVSTLLSYPFSKFFRLEGGVDGMAVTDKEYLECTIGTDGYIYYQDSATSTYPLFQGNGAIVFDNALWSYATPMRGLRMRVGAYSSFLSFLQYQTAYADLRGYLGITRKASLALRTFAGASFGRDYQWFSLGGAYDVRGYSTYNPTFGSKVVFSNLELRVPFVERLDLAFPLPLSIRDLRGVVFTDAGFIWDQEPLVLWDSTGALVDLKAGFGVGLRFLLGYWMLKLDFARPYVKTNPEDKGWDVWRVHFRIGADF